MEQITVRNLTFSYGRQEEPALQDVSFSVKKGEFFLIIGESGCGKTTLLRHLKPAFIPVGKRGNGCEILFAGKPMAELSEREQVSKIGYVGQNAEAAQATDKVWSELAFGMESLGYSQDMMMRRVAEITAFFGLESIFDKMLFELSGGEKQLVNLASVMAMEPDVLLLDEPTGQLDPMGTVRFCGMLKRIHQEIGTTIVMVSHCLEEILPMCHRVMVMDKGKVLFVDETKRCIDRLFREKHIMYGAVSAPARVWLESGKGNGQEMPLTVGEGKAYIEEVFTDKNGVPFRKGSRLAGDGSDVRTQDLTDGQEDFKSLEAGELWFRYGKDSPDILKGLKISLPAGKITAVLGGNGTGKSTLLQVLAGHIKPYSGKIQKVSGRVGVLPQNPQAMFTKTTVEQELLSVLHREPGRDKRTDLWKQVPDEFALGAKAAQHPHDLSGGEMQRLGLAKLILAGTDIFLLDEPEKGLDFAGKQRMGCVLQRLAKQGKTVLIVSHDLEFCARYADICGLFFEGNIVSLSDTKAFFRDNVFYTTMVQRMCRNVLPEAVLLEEVTGGDHVTAGNWVSGDNSASGDNGVPGDNNASGENCALGDDYTPGRDCVPGRDDISENPSGKPAFCEKGEKKSNRFHKLLTVFLFFVIMPATIYIGGAAFEQRKYYFISLLLLLEAMGTLFLNFEKRSPKLREVMVVAMMTAVTVAGRELFYMIPAIKPVAAMVILSGVSFGGEIGFLIGAMSMLVSNIFFGQGPWTPWQMFAMGMLGFFAGILFGQDGRISKKKKWGISIYGFLAVVILYGGVMNVSSVIAYQDNINSAMILTALGAGLPFDLLHGGGTFVMLMAGAAPLLGILNRIKEKYGFGMYKSLQTDGISATIKDR